MRAARSARSRAARSATRRSAASSPCELRAADGAPRPARAPCGARSMSQAARRSSSTACGARAVGVAQRRGRPRRACASAAPHGRARRPRRAASAPLLGLRPRASDSRDERVAAVALGQHALRAALRRLAQLAGEAEPRAAGARDGDAGEAGRQLIEVLDDPRVGQQPARERHRGRRPARRCRPGGARPGAGGVVRARRARRAGVGDQRAAAVGAGAVEQRAAGGEVVDDRRAEAPAERRRRARARSPASTSSSSASERAPPGRRRVRAQELVGRRELGADARGLAARRLGRASRPRGARARADVARPRRPRPAPRGAPRRPAASSATRAAAAARCVGRARRARARARPRARRRARSSSASSASMRSRPASSGWSSAACARSAGELARRGARRARRVARRVSRVRSRRSSTRSAAERGARRRAGRAPRAARCAAPAPPRPPRGGAATSAERAPGPRRARRAPRRRRASAARRARRAAARTASRASSQRASAVWRSRRSCSSAASAWRLSGRSRERASRSTSSARSRLSCVRSSLSCARRRRLRCLPRPAASSMSSRRSRGLEVTIASTRPWETTECISLPRPVSDSTSSTSTSRQRAPLRRYSPSPLRSSRRRIEISPTGRSTAPSALSSTISTSAERARLHAAAAAEDDVLHRLAADGERRLLAHRPQHGVGDVRLARAVGPDDDRHAGVELQPRAVGERLEALEGQRLQVHQSVLTRPRRRRQSSSSAARAASCSACFFERPRARSRRGRSPTDARDLEGAVVRRPELGRDLVGDDLAALGQALLQRGLEVDRVRRARARSRARRPRRPPRPCARSRRAGSRRRSPPRCTEASTRSVATSVDALCPTPVGRGGLQPLGHAEALGDRAARRARHRLRADLRQPPGAVALGLQARVEVRGDRRGRARCRPGRPGARRSPRGARSTTRG